MDRKLTNYILYKNRWFIHELQAREVKRRVYFHLQVNKLIQCIHYFYRSSQEEGCNNQMIKVTII